MNYYLKIIIHLRLFYHFNTNKKVVISGTLLWDDFSGAARGSSEGAS
jgi:hypothetical protein